MRFRIFLTAGATFLVMAGFNNCSSQGTSTGNPLVEVRINAYDPAAKVTSKISTQSLSSLKMCFKRLRFKMDSSSSEEDNVDLNLGEVTMDPNGTLITAITVPEGEYKRVEFDLDDNCSSGHAIQVTNNNGTFSTTDHTTIRFDGNFTASESSTQLELNMQAIVSALNTVTSNSQVRSKAESAAGDF